MLGIFLSVVTAVIFGVLALGLQYSLGFSSPATTVWLRFVIAFAGLAGIISFTEISSFEILRRPPLLGILGGIFLALNYFTYFQGLKLTSPNDAQVLIQSSPLLLAMIGVFFFKERLKRAQVYGVVIAVAGFFLFYFDQLEHFRDPSSYSRGNLWILVASITWALWGSFNKILLKKWSAQSINLIVFGTAALFSFPFAVPSELPTFNPYQWFILILLGLSTLFGYGALTKALKLIPATQVSLIITLNPIVTFIGVAILHSMGTTWLEPETLTGVGYAGAGIALAGVIVAIR